METQDRRGTGDTWNVIKAVRDIADAREIPMAEVALAWVHDRPGVASTILGTRTVTQLETNLRAVGLHLTAEETALLGSVSDPHATDYPYGPMGIEQCARTIASQ